MGTWLLKRIQAATGLLYVLVALTVLFIVTVPPAAGTRGDVVAKFYTVHGTAFMVGGWVCGAGELIYIWFLAYLRSVLARAEDGTYQLSTLSFVMGVAISTITFALTGIGQALPCLADEPSNWQLLQILSNVLETGFTTIFIPATLAVGAASVVMLRTAVLPRWVGIFGLVIAAVELFGSVSLVVMPGSFLTPGGLPTVIAYLSLLLWLAVVSVTLVVKADIVKA